jgi:hypothetical protein
VSMCDGSAGVAVFKFRSSVICILTHCVQFSFVIFTSSFLHVSTILIRQNQGKETVY